MASFMRSMRHFSEAQLDRYRSLADDEDQGPIRSRLFNIIDPNRIGQITADELRAALRLPVHAQAIAQIIIRKESEWFHRAHVWDVLDEMLGHSGSTPHLNWLAEKQRIKELSWWEEVAEKVGLPSWGKAYHFHPIGLVTNFPMKDECACGSCFGANFITTRYGQQHGPVYWGELKLEDFKGWDFLVNNGKVTTAERAILVAMSEKEAISMHFSHMIAKY
jgi:hypothetical protein